MDDEKFQKSVQNLKGIMNGFKNVLEDLKEKKVNHNGLNEIKDSIKDLYDTCKKL